MIELSHSKHTTLGIVGERVRRRVVSSIQAIQMRETGMDWQDINPELVYPGGKWVSQGAPYLIEFDANCGRRIYPDKTDKSKYIDIPAIPLFSTLPKSYEREKIVASHTDYDVTFGLTNTKVTFQVLMRKSIGSDRITFDIDAVGFDIAEMLKCNDVFSGVLAAKSNVGIPKPVLIDDKGEMRWLEWSYKNGQLELGFDLTDLVFPILLQNTTIDVDTAAEADDDVRYYNGSSWVWGNGTAFFSGYIGYAQSAAYAGGIGSRFVGINIPAGSTINSAIMKCNTGAWARTAVVVRSRISCQDQNNPGQIANEADHAARWADRVPYITYDGVPTWPSTYTYYSTIDFSSCVQDVVDNNGGTGNALLVLWNDFEDRSSNSSTKAHRIAATLHFTGGGGPFPKNLEIDYDEPVVPGGAGAWAAGAAKLLI